MIHFTGKIIKKNGHPLMQFGEEYKVDEIRDILLGMYNYLVSIDYKHKFTGKTMSTDTIYCAGIRSSIKCKSCKYFIANHTPADMVLRLNHCEYEPMGT